MAKKISLAEARSQFSDCVRKVEGGEAYVITRHGKPVAALIPASDLGQLQRRRAGPDGGLASVAGGWKGSEHLLRQLSRSHRTRPRKLPGS